MKKFYSLLLFVFISSCMYAQNSKDSLPEKTAEQHEIKAANHLKKDLEQKQLMAPPERIADTSAAGNFKEKRKSKKYKSAALKTNSIKQRKKEKVKRINHR